MTDKNPTGNGKNSDSTISFSEENKTKYLDFLLQSARFSDLRAKISQASEGEFLNTYLSETFKLAGIKEFTNYTLDQLLGSGFTENFYGLLKDYMKISGDIATNEEVLRTLEKEIPRQEEELFILVQGFRSNYGLPSEERIYPAEILDNDTMIVPIPVTLSGPDSEGLEEMTKTFGNELEKDLSVPYSQKEVDELKTQKDGLSIQIKDLENKVQSSKSIGTFKNLVIIGLLAALGFSGYQSYQSGDSVDKDNVASICAKDLSGCQDTLLGYEEERNFLLNDENVLGNKSNGYESFLIDRVIALEDALYASQNSGSELLSCEEKVKSLEAGFRSDLTACYQGNGSSVMIPSDSDSERLEEEIRSLEAGFRSDLTACYQGNGSVGDTNNQGKKQSEFKPITIYRDTTCPPAPECKPEIITVYKDTTCPPAPECKPEIITVYKDAICPPAPECKPQIKTVYKDAICPSVEDYVCPEQTSACNQYNVMKR